MAYEHFLRGARHAGNTVRKFATSGNAARVFSSAHNAVRRFGGLANQANHYAHYLNNNVLDGALTHNEAFKKGTSLLSTIGKIGE